MSSLTASEAFEILRFAQQYGRKLEEAADLLERKGAGETERAWAEQAITRLAGETGAIPAVIERARALPDLADAVQKLAEEDQGRWVDALEKLVAGITFTASSRSPLIEALLPHQKWPALRRAAREDVSRFQAEFERRSKTGYVTRMLASDDLAVVRPVMDQVSQSYARWFACFSPAALPEDEAQAIRSELRAAAERVDLIVRQSRLLAEAALVPYEGAFEELGLQAKPKKKASRGDVAAELATIANALGDAEPSGDEAIAAEAEAAADATASEAVAEPAEDAPSSDAESPAPKKRARKTDDASDETASAPKRTRKKAAPLTEDAAPSASQDDASPTPPEV